jgi:hypothetical protein
MGNLSQGSRQRGLLQRGFAALVVADANGFVDAGQKYFSVTDLSGAGGIADGLDRLLD